MHSLLSFPFSSFFSSSTTWNFLKRFEDHFNGFPSVFPLRMPFPRMPKGKFTSQKFQSWASFAKVINNSKLIFSAETKTFPVSFGFFLLSCWNVFKVNSDSEYLAAGEKRRELNIIWPELPLPNRCQSFGHDNKHQKEAILTRDGNSSTSCCY